MSKGFAIPITEDQMNGVIPKFGPSAGFSRFRFYNLGKYECDHAALKGHDYSRVAKIAYEDWILAREG
jgi:hypothetical protein